MYTLCKDFAELLLLLKLFPIQALPYQKPLLIWRYDSDYFTPLPQMFLQRQVSLRMKKWIPQQRKSKEAKLRDPSISYFLCSLFRFSYLEAMLKDRKRREKWTGKQNWEENWKRGEKTTFKNESASGTKVTAWVSEMWFRQPPHKNWSMPAVQTHPHSLLQQSVLRHLISIIHLPKVLKPVISCICAEPTINAIADIYPHSSTSERI